MRRASAGPARRGGGPLLVLALLVTPAAWSQGMPHGCQEMRATSGNFSVGGEGSSYADEFTRCWLLALPEPSGVLTIAFTFFQTEHAHDWVNIYDHAGTLQHHLSGEHVCPYVHRLESQNVTVEFVSDETEHSDADTLQLGFAAEWFDSSDGSCLHGCSGHGTCDTGTCSCDDEWGASTHGDCSIPVTKLVPGETHSVRDQPPGRWSYFSFHISAATSFLVELIDYGAANSDAMLVLNLNHLPTLSNKDYTDWQDWYYDSSDIHFMRGLVSAGTYYIGVLNDGARATAPLFANLTIRTRSLTKYPCIQDCNGHGSCKANGDCRCDDGWFGHHANVPDTCEYKLHDMQLDQPRTDHVRIGDWDFFVVHVDAHQEYARTLMVQFQSLSPHAYPILLVRRDHPPKLASGALPTFDAFQADYGDQEGFELLQGQRQLIRINSSELSTGDYYVGVFNLWSHNVIGGFNSHDTCDYELYTNLYAAGVPCPLVDGEFCAGHPCDFNTGRCSCPPDALWHDCSIATTPLVPDTPVLGSLAVEDAQYFHFEVTEAQVHSGLNVLITLTRQSPTAAVPYLLARFEGVPFPTDFAHYDDHDLVSNFRNDEVHQVLLDNEELRAGHWFVAVLNAEQSTEQLVFSLEATITDDVACPVDPATGLECAGVGTCVRALGRCDCPDALTLDDCSADGVFWLTPGEPSAHTPPIAADDWAYWAVNIGCQGLTLTVDFQTESSGAAPYLVMRRGVLPLMVAGTFDFEDYYTGSAEHGTHQRIRVKDCPSPETCHVEPLYPGTDYERGTPEPGIYYVGVFNDPTLAKETIAGYTVKATLHGSCDDVDECAPGFTGVGADKCALLCPGMTPTDEYSNTPFGDAEPCSGSGTCRLSSAGEAECACEAGFFGDDCGGSCPAACSEHGTCSQADLSCACDEGFAGAACAAQCPVAAPQWSPDVTGGRHGAAACAGFGTCTESAPGSAVGECDCVAGVLGATCELPCPGVDASSGVCGGHGTCLAVVDDASLEPLWAECRCALGHLGTACDLPCPGLLSVSGGKQVPCNGNGNCALGKGGSPECACYSGYEGDACQTETASGGDGGSSHGGAGRGDDDNGGSARSPLSAGAIAGIFFGMMGLMCATGAGVMVAERRRRVIGRYERVMRDSGLDVDEVRREHREQDARRRSGGPMTALSLFGRGGGRGYRAPATNRGGFANVPSGDGADGDIEVQQGGGASATLRASFDEPGASSSAVSPFHSEQVEL